MIGDCLVFKHKGIYDLGISLFEDGSPYTHVALDCGDGTLIESYPGVGVRIRPIPDDPEMDRFRMDGILHPEIETPLRWAYAINVAKTQVGKPYDVPGIVDYVIGHRLLDHHGWFCSELVDAIYAWAGIMIEHGDCAYVNPARFSRPPFVQVTTGG